MSKKNEGCSRSSFALQNSVCQKIFILQRQFLTFQHLSGVPLKFQMQVVADDLQQGFLRGNVLVQRFLGHAQFAGNVIHMHRHITTPTEQRNGDGHDFFKWFEFHDYEKLTGIFSFLL
jgi:hypothetical protein